MFKEKVNRGLQKYTKPSQGSSEQVNNRIMPKGDWLKFWRA